MIKFLNSIMKDHSKLRKAEDFYLKDHIQKKLGGLIYNLERLTNELDIFEKVNVKTNNSVLD